MSGGVLVTDFRGLGVIDSAERWMATRCAHVLHVPLPSPTRRGELAGKVGHAGGVYASLTHSLSRRHRLGADERRVGLTVTLGLRVWPLAGELPDVVGQRVVRRPEILVEQDALAAQRR